MSPERELIVRWLLQRAAEEGEAYGWTGDPAAEQRSRAWQAAAVGVRDGAPEAWLELRDAWCREHPPAAGAPA
jgi:hypothetical protein